MEIYGNENRNGNLAMEIPWSNSSCPLFPGQIGISNVVFAEGGKP